MSKKVFLSVIGIGIFAIVISACLVGYYHYKNYYLPSKYTLPPPLENVDFPSEQTQYPADWPDELKFPNEFVLVDSSSGKLPENTVQGWAAKFRYKGKPSEAEKVMSPFLKERGWTIVESHRLDSGGYSLLIQLEQGSGIIIIDDDPNTMSESLIIATIFP
jgi:hypothetical protein